MAQKAEPALTESAHRHSMKLPFSAYARCTTWWTMLTMTARRDRPASDQQLPPLPAEDHACGPCALVYPDITIDQAVRTIGGLPGAIRESISSIPPDALRQRPSPGVWSVTEYVCHLRDVYITYTIRLHRTRTENRPVIEPMLNDLRARRLRYNDRDLPAMLGELSAATEGFCEEIARTSQQDWDRIATRLPGEQRTARWLVRQAMHEGVHHLADIRRIGAQVAGTANAQDERTGHWSAANLASDVAAEAMEAAMAYLQQVDSGPVWRPIDRRDREWLVNQPLPEQSRSLPDLIGDINAHVLAYPMGNGHRRFFGWVNSPPSAAGVAVEPLAAALNPSCAGGEHAGALLERTAVRWLAELIGYPTPPGGGILTSGASMASIIALAAGRNRAARRYGVNIRHEGLWGRPPLVVYTSSEAHSCITKAVELLGMGRRSLHRIPVNDLFAMDTTALAAAIADDTGAGLVPCAVVATAGTVNTGAIDDLATIAKLAADHDMWMHVDGAYGALAAAHPALHAQFTGMERADSIAVDAHKWLGVPIDSGALLVQDPSALRETFSLVPDYLRDETADDVGWWSEYGIEQTRPFRALRTWATIAHLGRRGIGELVGRTTDLAAGFATLLENEPDLELLAPVITSVVAFRFTGKAAAEHDLDRINNDLPALLQLRGNVFLTGTTLRGRPVLRACFLNPLVTEEDLRLLIDEIRTVSAQLTDRQ
jgi:aromatic-L-amino-acid decarboxylase